MRTEVIARGGDRQALETIKGLYETGFVDGLVRRLDRGWRLLDRDDVEDVVAEAILGLYDAVADGRNVKQPEAYVFKAAKKIASARHEQIRGSRNLEDEHPAPDPNADEQGTPGYADLRAEALRVARRLLPRLGQANVTRVMSLVFDAVEADIPDITPAEIAEALGLSGDVARQSLHRGFRRLERIAREEGLQLDFGDVLAEESPLLDEEEDEDDH